MQGAGFEFDRLPLAAAADLQHQMAIILRHCVLTLRVSGRRAAICLPGAHQNFRVR